MGSVIKKRGRPVGSKNKPSKSKVKVNWERLAKQLQTALSDEFKESQGLSERINNLQYQVANLEHQAIGYRAILSYLENKLGNDTV
jgi:DNA anti-recombination protein RmuC